MRKHTFGPLLEVSSSGLLSVAGPSCRAGASDELLLLSVVLALGLVLVARRVARPRAHPAARLHHLVGLVHADGRVDHAAGEAVHPHAAVAQAGRVQAQAGGQNRGSDVVLAAQAN